MNQQTTPKERGLPLSPDLAQAANEDRKTETRRVIVPQPELVSYAGGAFANGSVGFINENGRSIICPYGKPGDRLWVREEWATHRIYDELPPRSILEDNDGIVPMLFYAGWPGAGKNSINRGRWRRGRFMPRWASRTLLEVIGVEVERVQEITEAAALREGIYHCHRFPSGGTSHDPGYTWNNTAPLFPTASAAFFALYDSLNAQRGYSVETNPWCWVIKFQRINQ